MRRIEEIKSTLDEGEDGAAEIRAAAHLLEQSVPVGEVLAAVADREFPNALTAAARGCEGECERAWLTLAAAGRRRARQVLACRASQLLDPTQLAALAVERRRHRGRALEHLVATADGPESAAASRLLAHLSGAELRALVRARPTLAAAYRLARITRRRVARTPSLSPALGVG